MNRGNVAVHKVDLYLDLGLESLHGDGLSPMIPLRPRINEATGPGTKTYTCCSTTDASHGP